MVSEAGDGEIIVKMILSADELEKFIGAAPGGAQVSVTQAPTKVAVEKASPAFMSIFKPLVALEAVKVGIKSLVAHSSIANTYLGAMGKMFGAAVDLLLLPFTPLLNMLMLGMSKLIQWLITSGMLEKIHAGVLNVVTFLEDMGENLRNIWRAVRDFNVADLATGIGGSIADIAKFSIQHPIEAAVLAGASALMARGAWRFLFGAPGAGAAGGAAGGGAAGGAAAGAGGGAAAAGGGIVGPLIGGAALVGGGAYIMGKGAQVATENMLAILRGTGGTAMDVAKGTMAFNIFTPTGLTAALAAGGGAAAIKGIRGLFGGGGGGKQQAEEVQVSLLQEQNQILKGMAGYRPSSIYQDVTIYGTQPELIAAEVLEQNKAAGLSTALE